MRPAAAAVAARAQAQARVVLVEMEALLADLLARQQSTIALARKPYVSRALHAQGRGGGVPSAAAGSG